MAELSLSAPARWRFTDADDIAAYGDRWWSWDPVALARSRGRKLVDLEEAIGMPFVLLLEQLAVRTSMGVMAALWLSMHEAGSPVEFDKDFSPLIFTVEWEKVPAAAPLDSGEDPTPDSSSSPAPATESATS